MHEWYSRFCAAVLSALDAFSFFAFRHKIFPGNQKMSSSSSAQQRIVCGDEAHAVCSVPNVDAHDESLFAVACSSSSSGSSGSGNRNPSVKIYRVDAQTHRLKEKSERAVKSASSSSGATKIVDVDCHRGGMNGDDAAVERDSSGVVTIAACTSEGTVSVFREDDGEEEEGKNVKSEKTGGVECSYSSCKFDPNGDGRVLAMVTSGGESVSFYDRERDAFVESFRSSSSSGSSSGSAGLGGGKKRCAKGDWSKTNRNQFAFAKDGDVFVVDSRSSSSDAKAVFSQASAFRDVAFSASEDGRYMITASEDWLVKTWDLRKNGREPVKCFAGHEGTVTKSRFNPVYESIVMSSSLDGTVKLWRDSDLGRLPDDDDSGRRRSKMVNIDENSGGSTNSEGVDVELKAYGNLQTTTVGSFSPVVDACWSSNDPWVFAAITMDGIVALDVVPRSEKYRILL
jgi:WD40 repeat protein